MNSMEMLKKFEPTGGGRLGAEAGMKYLRMELAFKACAADLLEYVDAGPEQFEAFQYLMEAKNTALNKIAGGKPATKEEEKKGFFSGKKRSV